MKADLIILSSCKSGLGKIVTGEGMVGFMRSLMFGGTPSVILSLWPVADNSTADLFINYYQTLQASGFIDKQAALRQAQLNMINSTTRYNNPFYWAPFIFIGER